MTTTVQKWGNSRAVRLPKNLADELGLKTGTEVSLVKTGAGLLLKPAKTKRRIRLSDLLAKCRGPNPHRAKWTKAAGKELL